MDLIIKNASLEEVTAICYRIGEPNFNEMVEANRKFGVVEYLTKHGSNITDAINTYEKSVQDTKVHVALKTNHEEEVPEAAEIVHEVVMDEPKQVQTVQEKVEPVHSSPQTAEALHLDKPPEEPKTPVINLEENLHQLATKLVQEKGALALTKVLNSFGAQSLPELNKNHYEAAITQIKDIL